MGEVVNIKRPLGIPDSWGDAALYAAVKAHVFGGNVQEILPMSDADVAFWTKSPQWLALTRAILPEVREVMVGQLARIHAQALNQLSERIVYGDPVIQIDGTPKMDDDGKPVHRPLRAKDLSDIAGKVLDQQKTLMGKGESEKDDDVPGLADLLTSLKRLAQAKEIVGERV